MATPTNSSDISLQRFPDLLIKPDTPKGILVPSRMPLHEKLNLRILGRGVFATKSIPAKTIIDTCPVLVLSAEENVKHIEHTSLYHYT